MSILTISDITHTYGDKRLFNKASLTLNRGDKMGLTGPNGSGKSTLMNMMIGEVIPDEGSIKWLPRITYAYLDQYAKIDPELTIEGYLKTAFDHLYNAEQEQREIYRRIDAGEGDTVRLAARAALLDEYLHKNGYFTIGAEIGRVAAGLGLTAMGMDTGIRKLSGGQREKILLAKLLLDSPDVLLLDEPTNFLDRQHIDWLTKYLSDFDGSFVIISHDKVFLDGVTNCISDIEFASINRYAGSFLTAEKLKAVKKDEHIKNYQHQQKEIKKLEEYVAKNITRASTSNMAKSRQKKLDKMDRLEKPSELPKPSFGFKYKKVNTDTFLEVEDLSIGYYYPIIKNINFVLKRGEKVAVTGFNGIGKTTMLKTISGIIPSFGGTVKFGERVEAGYYEQDLAWEDDTQTPLEELGRIFSNLDLKDLRAWLGRCGLKREHMESPIELLSGGEQARVKICRLMMSEYTMLVLDEPTNHLDAGAKDSLVKALAKFEGSVILVSHDPEFYSGIVDRVFDIEKLLGK